MANLPSMLALISPDKSVPAKHLIRQVKVHADAILHELSTELAYMYVTIGRDSLPPEWPLKGSLPIAVFSVCSERQFCEQLEYELMYRWFLDMVWSGPQVGARNVMASGFRRSRSGFSRLWR